jgi:hypothetical protein
VEGERGLDLSGLIQRQVAGPCQRSNELPGSKISWVFVGFWRRTLLHVAS